MWSLLSRIKTKHAGTFSPKLKVFFVITVTLYVFQASIENEAKAVNSWNTEGASGEIYIKGILSEGACRLDMSSAYQTINLGITSTANLTEVGSVGKPSILNIQLLDCIRGMSKNANTQNGNLLWDSYQPSAAINFIAAMDVNSPELMKVEGTSGLALRLENEEGKIISFNTRGEPLLLKAGLNTLTYRVIPERTLAPLQAGEYSARMYLRLSYD